MGRWFQLRLLQGSGHQYMSRKGYAALNVCIKADALGRILYINSAFPGSFHDSTVWSRCSFGRAFDAGHFALGYQLLGDSGYANGRGIMAPFRPTSVHGNVLKTRFSREHRRVRCIVERTIGRWKKKFTSLSTEMRLGPELASKMVIACAVLHNLSYCLGVTKIRQLRRRKANMPHPPPEELNIREYVARRL